MADIQLTRPAANQTQTVTSTADARFVLNFPTGEAKLAKSENGENLILTFDDGAKIEVEGFYTTFDKDSLPTLNVGGQDITGEQLVAILGEDLMPAAGPSAGQAAAQGGRFRSFADSDLNGGIDRLGGLDIGFDGAAAQAEAPEGYYALADDAATTGEVTPEPAPTPVPGPTPRPEPTPEPPVPDFLKAQDDAYTGGIMNTYTLSNLVANDTLGAIMPDSVRDFTVKENNTYGGKVEMVGNDLTLTLDGDALQDALYESGVRGPIIQGSINGSINTAKHVKPVDGQLEVKYTAQDASGAYTDTATATITVGDNAVTMQGGDGKDVAWVAGNTGRIETGNGQDVIVAGSNSGAINGGAGSDSLYVGSSDGIVDGGDGDDKLNFSGTNSGQVFGGLGNDTITVYENAGKIDGGDDGDYIDIVEGSMRSDDGKATNSVYGGTGGDTLVLRGGSSYMDGGNDSDLLKAQGDDDEHIWKYNPDAAEKYDAQYATLVGGAERDTLSASDGSHHNVLYGDFINRANTTMDGNDSLQVINYSHDNTLYGGGGGDTMMIAHFTHSNAVYGDGGNDTIDLKGQTQYNTVHGGADNDSLMVHRGPATPPEISRPYDDVTRYNELYGDAGNDILLAYDDAAHNTLVGGADNDKLTVEGSAHHNTLYGDDTNPANATMVGNDFFTVKDNAHDNTLYGGAGEDKMTVEGSAHHNTLKGGADGDSLYAHNSAHDNLLQGEAGDDVLQVEGPNSQTTRNILEGGAGADTLHALGSVKGNTLDGGSNNDELYAKDYVTGNTLYGREGDDSLYAQGNAAKNTLDGGTGSDTLFAEKNATDNTLKGGDDNDWLYVQGNAQGNELYGENGADVLIAHDTAKGNSLNGGAEADRLVVMESATGNTLNGGEGADVLLGNAGSSTNTLQGGTGDDSLYVGHWAADQYADMDIVDGQRLGKSNGLNVEVSNTVLEGNDGADTFYARGRGHHNTFFGHDSIDPTDPNLHSSGGAADTDTFKIYDQTNNSTFYGQGGDDVFEIHAMTTGLIKQDSLYGGDGNDTFVSIRKVGSNAHIESSLLDGGKGDDVFLVRDQFGNNGSDPTKGNTLKGGEGDDIFIYGGPTTGYSDGAAKNNLFQGDEGNDFFHVRPDGSSTSLRDSTLEGGSGEDVFVVQGYSGFNTLDGGAGNDLFDASREGNNGFLNFNTFTGGEGLDVLLLADGNASADFSRLNGVEAIITKGASGITSQFNYDLVDQTIAPTDPLAGVGEEAYTSLNAANAANRLTQAGVKSILGGMGLVWEDDAGDGNNIFRWSDKTDWDLVGSRTINGDNYQEFAHTSGGEVDLKILINALNNDWNG